MMLLSDYLKSTDIELIHNKLKKLAMTSLTHILNNNYTELELNTKQDIQTLTFQESLSVILTGDYTELVFQMCLKIYKDEMYLGYYHYLTTLDLTFVDEFFVIR
jgi:hypothetical protein